MLTVLQTKRAWVDVARQSLPGMLAAGPVTADAVATATGVSLRTLQRRLAEEGTSFSELLEGVRRDLALSGLQDDRLSMAELSRRLGYRRQSALTRAVRRWTGMAPTELRRRGA